MRCLGGCKVAKSLKEQAVNNVTEIVLGHALSDLPSTLSPGSETFDRLLEEVRSAIMAMLPFALLLLTARTLHIFL